MLYTSLTNFFIHYIRKLYFSEAVTHFRIKFFYRDEKIKNILIVKLPIESTKFYILKKMTIERALLYYQFIVTTTLVYKDCQ